MALIKYARDRFLESTKITGANIYIKDNKVRVAISIDTQDPEKKTVFSDEFQSPDHAEAYVKGGCELK